MAINSRLTLENQQFISALEASAGAFGKFVGQVSVQMRNTYRDIDYLNRGLKAGIGRFGQELQSLGKSLTIGITAPIALFAKEAIEAYARIDSLRRGLLAIEGSASATAKRFGELREVAKLPGLGLEEAIQGDIRLRAVGISAETSKRALLAFGNAIATTGGGKMELGTVITQLSQMSSKSKVLAEDLKPILNASPLVATALRNMFGTVDSQEISKKLSDSGKSVSDFVSMLIFELEKIPKVSGGMANALENVSDSVKIAFSTFGESIDKAIGLTDILNGLGETINDIADWFKGLDPNLQTAIVSFTGLASVLGPVIFAVGSLAKMIASGGVLSAGLTALTGPIGAIALAVIALATVIITYWDEIKQVITDSRIFDEAMALWDNFTGMIKGVINAFLSFSKFVWANLKDTIVPYFESAFSGAITVIRSFIGVVSGVFQVLKGVFTLSWKDIWEGLKGIVSNVFDAIFTIITSVVVQLSTVLGKFFKTIGIGDGLLKWSTEMATFLGKTAGLEGIKGKPSVAEIGSGTPTSTSTKTFNTGSSQSETSKAYSKYVAEEMKRISELNDSLQKQLGKNREYIFNQAQSIWDIFAKSGERLSKIKLEIKPIEFSGFTKSIDVITENLEKYHSSFEQFNQGLLSVNTQLQGRMTEFNVMNADLVTNLVNMNKGIRNAVVSALGDAISGISELIGNVIAGIANFGDAPKMLAGIFADMAVQIGKIMIGFGVAGIALQSFEMDPVLALIAGAGLVALGSALKASVSSVTSGGASSSYTSTSSASSSNLQNQKKATLTVEVKGETVLRGKDIYLAYKNAETSQRIYR